MTDFEYNLNTPGPSILKSRSTGLFWGVVFFATIILFIAALWFNIAYLPYLLEGNPEDIANHHRISSNAHLQRLIYDAAISEFHPIAKEIIGISEAFEKTDPNERVSFEVVTKSNVKHIKNIEQHILCDAFFAVDFSERKGFLYFGEVDIERMITSLDVNTKVPTSFLTIDSRGWVNSVRLVEVEQQLILLRYFDKQANRGARGVVGAVINRANYYSMISEQLDSLALNSRSFLFANPEVIQDEYARKVTVGVVANKDTLWWFGDPHKKITDYESATIEDRRIGMISPIGSTSIKIVTHTEIPDVIEIAKIGGKFAKRVILGIQMTALAIILSLSLLYWLIRRKLLLRQF